MKNTKKEFIFYPYYDSQGHARHFEEMEAAGWQLQNPGNSRMCFTYRRVQPAQVSYAVTYFADASVYDSSLDRDRQQFVDMCRAAGWQRVGGINKLQIFRNQDPDATPLETDPVLTVEVIHDSMKNSMIVSGIAMMTVCILQLWMRLDMISENVAFYLADWTYLLFAGAWAGLMLFYIFELSFYYSWYFAAKKRAADGFLHPVKNGRAKGIASAVFVAVLTLDMYLWIATISIELFLFTMLFIAASTAVSVAVPALVRKFGRDNVRNRKTGPVIIIAVTMALFFGFRGLMANMEIRNPWEKQPVYVIEDYVDTLDFKVYKDTLPVYISHLTGRNTDTENYTFEHTEKKSPLMEYHQFLQAPLPDCNGPMLRITVAKPAGILYDYCLDSMLNEYEKVNKKWYRDNPYYYEEIPARDWQAEKAWRLAGGNYNKTPRYIAAYGSYILCVQTDIDMTADMIHTVAEKISRTDFSRY